MVIDWPDIDIIHQSWYINSKTASAGVGIDGREQKLSTNNQTRGGTVTFGNINGPKTNLFEATIEALDGRFNQLRLPVHNPNVTITSNPTATAPIGATGCNVSNVSELIIGAFFSVDDFLYRVGSIGGNYITFKPALRTALNSGTLDFINTKIRVYLTEDDAGRLKTNYGFWGEQITINFVEAFDR